LAARARAEQASVLELRTEDRTRAVDELANGSTLGRAERGRKGHSGKGTSRAMNRQQLAARPSRPRPPWKTKYARTPSATKPPAKSIPLGGADANTYSHKP